MESLRRLTTAAVAMSGISGLTGAIRSFEGFAQELFKGAVTADPPVPKRRRKSFWSPPKQTHRITYFAPDKRNSARECARRRRQMAAGTHGYVYGDRQRNIYSVLTEAIR